MGTWGITTFEDDEALDWLSELDSIDDASLLEESIQPDEYDMTFLDAGEAARILCAAEIIAGIVAFPSVYLPEEAKDWIRAHKDLNVSSLVPLATTMIDRVLSDESELNELWQENEEDYPKWKKMLLDLKKRLSS